MTTLCWICFDSGVVQYTKKVQGNYYDFYASCKCGYGTKFRGQGKTHSIPRIKQLFDDKTIQNIESKNKELYGPRHNEVIDFKTLKEQIQNI